MFIVERASPSLRGQLTRWMLEVRAGVYVGTLSARVRDKLWQMIKARNATGSSLLIFRARNEQGFSVQANGDASRTLIDIDGLALVRRAWPGAPGPAPSDGPAPKPARKPRK